METLNQVKHTKAALVFAAVAVLTRSLNKFNGIAVEFIFEGKEKAESMSAPTFMLDSSSGSRLPNLIKLKNKPKLNFRFSDLIKKFEQRQLLRMVGMTV